MIFKLLKKLFKDHGDPISTAFVAAHRLQGHKLKFMLSSTIPGFQLTIFCENCQNIVKEGRIVIDRISMTTSIPKRVIKSMNPKLIEEILGKVYHND